MLAKRQKKFKTGFDKRAEPEITVTAQSEEDKAEPVPEVASKTPKKVSFQPAKKTRTIKLSKREQKEKEEAEKKEKEEEEKRQKEEEERKAKEEEEKAKKKPKKKSAFGSKKVSATVTPKATATPRQSSVAPASSKNQTSTTPVKKKVEKVIDPQELVILQATKRREERAEFKTNTRSFMRSKAMGVFQKRLL